MAASNKNLVKKINSILPFENEKDINKHAKRVLVKKAILKKTRIEVVKQGLEKSHPIKKTVAKNNFVTAVHLVACGMASQKRSAKKMALIKVENIKRNEVKK